MADVSQEQAAGRRLGSWKEIAAYFGKDERTVKRWETTRGLPVRRLPRGTRSSVFAYQDELEAWLRGKPALAAQGEPPESVARGSRVLTWPAVAILAVVVLAVAAAAALYLGAGSTHVPPASAAEFYKKGSIDWSSRTEEGFHRAIAEFDQAIAIDPQYARAYAGLANTYNLISQYTSAPAVESYAKGKAAAEQAIALDPQMAEGYAALAFNLFYGSHEFQRANDLFDLALALDPNSAQALHWAALTSLHLGEFSRPLDFIDRAQQLMPDSRSIQANRALILFYAGRAEEALSLLQDLKQAHPDYLATPSYLATIFLATGHYTDFLDAYEQAATVSKNSARLAIVAKAREGYASGGNSGMLAALLDAQLAAYRAGSEPAYPAAVTAAMLDRRDVALGLLEDAVAQGDSDVLSLRIETAFQPLYGEPRFRALLTKVGLPLPN
jgi:tetratricopeptide (TPR) repeat protein